MTIRPANSRSNHANGPESNAPDSRLPYPNSSADALNVARQQGDAFVSTLFGLASRQRPGHATTRQARGGRTVSTQPNFLYEPTLASTSNNPVADAQNQNVEFLESLYQVYQDQTRMNNMTSWLTPTRAPTPHTNYPVNFEQQMGTGGRTGGTQSSRPSEHTFVNSGDNPVAPGRNQQLEFLNSLSQSTLDQTLRNNAANHSNHSPDPTGQMDPERRP